MAEWCGRNTCGSLRFESGDVDHFGPLLGLHGNELAERGGRSGKRDGSQVGEVRLDFGISERRVDLLVQALQDVNRSRGGRDDPIPTARLIAREKFA